MIFYETMYIVHPALEAGRLKDLILSIEKTLLNSGGKTCAIGFFLITIVLYGVQTYSRNQVWMNDLSLYSQTVLDSPNSAG